MIILNGGGVADKHNYDRNIHYDSSFEDELFKQRYIIPKLQQNERESMDLVFKSYTNPIVVENIKSVYNRYTHIRVNEALATDKFLGDVVTKRYEETIFENIQIMEKFIESVKNFNSQCKIIYTLIPRYITMEKTLSIFMKQWQDDFENILRDIQRKYGVYFLNYKNCIDISKNHRLFWDISHLNTIGGRCMTSILNQDLKKIKKSRNNKEWII